MVSYTVGPRKVSRRPWRSWTALRGRLEERPPLTHSLKVYPGSRLGIIRRRRRVRPDRNDVSQEKRQRRCQLELADSRNPQAVDRDDRRARAEASAVRKPTGNTHRVRKTPPPGNQHSVIYRLAEGLQITAQSTILLSCPRWIQTPPRCCSGSEPRSLPIADSASTPGLPCQKTCHVL